MQLTSLTPVLAESTTGASGINPWLVGIIIFAVLAAMMLGLLAFGAGRDHT